MHRFTSTLLITASLIAALLIAADGAAQAQSAPDEVLAENAFVKLTRADYETELLRIPPEQRGEFAASPKRLTTLLNQILTNKTLAKQARDTGLDRDPEIARRLAHETDRFYAQAEMLKMEQDAAAEFDARKDDFLAKARETYLLNKDKYRLPEQVSASHILFETTKRGEPAALALAKETRAKLLAGADFATLAREVSDDPSAKTNRGDLGWFGAGTMDPVFTKAAFALKNAGDISEPVLTPFGYHLIRLDGRRAERQRPFEQASKEIMAEIKQRYVRETREAKVNAIRNDPSMKVNQAAIDALVVKLPEVPKLTQPPAPALR
jgi:peptidyl-prolyl cis-trans isomerase C